MFLSKIPDDTKEPIKELLPDDQIRIVPIEEYSTRISISICDIKVTNETKIGKKHFIEIFYYVHALAFYLYENTLDSMFFVQVDKNGILLNINEFYIVTMSELEEYVIFIKWDETRIIFESIISKLHEILTDIPKDIANTDILEIEYYTRL